MRSKARWTALFLALTMGATTWAWAQTPPSAAKPKPATTPKPATAGAKPKGAVTKSTTTVKAYKDTTAVGEIRADAMALRPLVKSAVAIAFLDSTRALPNPGSRTLYMDSTRANIYSESQARALGDSAKAKLISRTLSESYYYNTRYGTPLAYARPIDLWALQGVKTVAGLHILDFGYGGIGQLRLLASMGANVVGVDVDPILPILYSEPGDQGGVPGRGGKITLVNGRFPAGPGVAEKVGTGYDLFLSKNTLKHGYIHPTRPADKRQLVDLGVDDSTFVAAVYGILKPGGYVMIYNLSPAPSKPDEIYRPWTDGHDPFPQELWQKAGFEVIAYDQVDDEPARAMGHALKWDEGDSGMNLATDLFGRYTLLRKKGK